MMVIYSKPNKENNMQHYNRPTSVSKALCGSYHVAEKTNKKIHVTFKKRGHRRVFMQLQRTGFL